MVTLRRYTNRDVTLRTDGQQYQGRVQYDKVITSFWDEPCIGNGVEFRYWFVLADGSAKIKISRNGPKRVRVVGPDVLEQI